MNKVRIAIFGISHNHATPMLEALTKLKDVEIIGLYEENQKLLEQKTSECANIYKNIKVLAKDELFSLSPDAVMIESDVPYLTDMALECAERGIHIYMDKPASPDISKYKRLLKCIMEKGLYFQTGYLYRYNLGVKYLFDRINSGALGKIQNICARFTAHHPEHYKKQYSNYRIDIDTPAMYIFGPHFIDLCLKLRGEPNSISSFHASSGTDGYDFNDTSVAIMTYDNGLTTIKATWSEINAWPKREFSVYCEKGSISINPFEGPLVIKETLATDAVSTKDCSKIIDIRQAPRYDEMLQHFVEAVKDSSKRDTDLEHEYFLQKYTMLACGHSVD